MEMEARRHSIDIPLSKTLVALRRVRSLRDPSTNSMSKFAASVDSLYWENKSFNGFALPDENGNGEYTHGHHRHLKSSCLESKREESGSDPEFVHTSGKVKTLKEPFRVPYEGEEFMETEKNNSCELSKECSYELPVSLQSCSDSKEDFDFYSEFNLDLMKSERCVMLERKKKRPRKHGRLIYSIRNDDWGDRDVTDGPSMLINNETHEFSKSSSPIFANEVVDVVGLEHLGCGISCWSRRGGLKDHKILSETEEYPLLSSKGDNIYCKNDENFHSNNSRSLSQKFRPRSFDELVGQSVLSNSLMNAISRGKIANVYLFYGPRGTGKSSACRIFAQALNCLSLKKGGPCGSCEECVIFLSGKRSCIKTLDSARANKNGGIKSLLRSASTAPFSKFTVYIFDECQLLLEETWAALLNGIEALSQNVVFIMVTVDLDKLPLIALSRCQRYHFQRIKDADIFKKLEKICLVECLEFDKVALDFIAARSCGSLRDAERMLEQMSLLGKRITLSLAHELIGSVSDEELLDLLDLALSSDTSNTIRRARELMASRVDPMQLISQLANLIMDILGGRCHLRSSQIQRLFSQMETSETDLQRLRHALKVLTEAEKQLRVSKNQTTWLTAALLQLSAGDSSMVDAVQSTAHPRKEKQNGVYNRTSEEYHDAARKLEIIWRRATEKCQSSRFRRFLWGEGRLGSLCIIQDRAVAEVEFGHPDHVSKAEKSWEVIANSLEIVLGCDVDIRINLVPFPYAKTNAKMKKWVLDFWCFSNNDLSDFSSKNTNGSVQSEKMASQQETSSSSSIIQTGCLNIMRSEDNLNKVNQENSFDRNWTQQNWVGCIPGIVKNHRSPCSPNHANMCCLGVQADSEIKADVHNKSNEANFDGDGTHSHSNPSRLKISSDGSPGKKKRDIKSPAEYCTKLHCLQVPNFSCRKKKNQRRESLHLMNLIFPCATARRFAGMN